MDDKEIEKYDIAISFLAEDEDLAVKIYSDLSSSLRVFVFSKKQQERAGTDGIETLREIFKEKSNSIVILHRKK